MTLVGLLQLQLHVEQFQALYVPAIKAVSRKSAEHGILRVVRRFLGNFSFGIGFGPASFEGQSQVAQRDIFYLCFGKAGNCTARGISAGRLDVADCNITHDTYARRFHVLFKWTGTISKPQKNRRSDFVHCNVRNDHTVHRATIHDFQRYAR